MYGVIHTRRLSLLPIEEKLDVYLPRCSIGWYTVASYWNTSQWTSSLYQWKWSNMHFCKYCLTRSGHYILLELLCLIWGSILIPYKNHNARMRRGLGAHILNNSCTCKKKSVPESHSNSFCIFIHNFCKINKHANKFCEVQPHLKR